MDPKQEEVSGVKPHAGGCHCGTVRVEANLDLQSVVSRCNCTVCTKLAWTSSIVKPSAFKVLSAAEELSEYRVGESVHPRFFCKKCGVHVFGTGHLEEVGGDYVSVNVNCLDEVEPRALGAQGSALGRAAQQLDGRRAR